MLLLLGAVAVAVLLSWLPLPLASHAIPTSTEYRGRYLDVGWHGDSVCEGGCVACDLWAICGVSIRLACSRVQASASLDCPCKPFSRCIGLLASW